MSEQAIEVKPNWKEALIADYLRLREDIAAERDAMDSDPDLNMLYKKQKKLNESIETMESLYRLNIETRERQQTDIRRELEQNWDIEDKTFRCDAGTAMLRTTKSLVIKDKGKLIEFLQTVKKLGECIRNFDVTKLRKFKEAGLIENGVAEWDEKKNVVIRAIETTVLEEEEKEQRK
jgi:hypothetical protein